MPKQHFVGTQCKTAPRNELAERRQRREWDFVFPLHTLSGLAQRFSYRKHHHKLALSQFREQKTHRRKKQTEAHTSKLHMGNNPWICYLLTDLYFLYCRRPRASCDRKTKQNCKIAPKQNGTYVITNKPTNKQAGRLHVISAWLLCGRSGGKEKDYCKRDQNGRATRGNKKVQQHFMKDIQIETNLKQE